MSDEKTIDLAKAAEKLADAQEEVKLAHTAMQACAKAWDGIDGAGDAKRQMYAAFKSARDSFVHTCKREARAFGILDTVVGQGDLFNDGNGSAHATTEEPRGTQGPIGTVVAVPPRPRRGGPALPPH